MLCHSNIVADVRNYMLDDGFTRIFNGQGCTLLFLPLAHCYAQLIQYGAIYSRSVLGLADVTDAVAQLQAYKPTAVLSVPRLWEKAYDSAKHKAAADGHGKIFC
jgi:long-chain acyl-CoA synthetase